MALGRKWVVAPVLGLAVMATVSATASADQTIPVTLTEFSFTPDAYNVRAGETVHFQLSNSGRFGHDMHIQGPGLDTEAVPGSGSVRPGESVTFDVTFPAAGTYQVWCPVQDHRDRGMVATVVVAGAQAAPSQLPRTGDLAEVGPALGGIGMGLAGLGFFLRRRLAGR